MRSSAAYGVSPSTTTKFHLVPLELLRVSLNRAVVRLQLVRGSRIGHGHCLSGRVVLLIPTCGNQAILPQAPVNSLHLRQLQDESSFMHQDDRGCTTKETICNEGSDR